MGMVSDGGSGGGSPDQGTPGEGHAPFTVSVSAGDPAMVTLTGEIDIAASEPLKQELGAALGSRRPASIIVDVAGVSFIDSSGLAVLIDLSQQVAPVVLRNASSTIRRVVAATGLDDVLPSEP